MNKNYRLNSTEAKFLVDQHENMSSENRIYGEIRKRVKNGYDSAYIFSHVKENSKVECRIFTKNIINQLKSDGYILTKHKEDVSDDRNKYKTYNVYYMVYWDLTYLRRISDTELI